MTWNTLDVPLETGWQCTLIPGPQYRSITWKSCDDMTARWLYPNAGRAKWPASWNEGPQSEAEKRKQWEQDRRNQLADDEADFARHFRPNWDLRTITGENALREVQTFVRDRLNVAHWNLPTDNAEVRKLLCDAVASGRLVPVVNREYTGLARVAQPDPAPQRWPAIGGGGYAYEPKVISYGEFQALQRANGELPALSSLAGGAVGATLGPRPDLGAPATADDGFGLVGIVESTAAALLGGGDDDSDSGDDAGGGAFEVNVFTNDNGDSTPLGDAQVFQYTPDALGGDVVELAANDRGSIYACDIISSECKGSVLREFPGQYLNSTLNEIQGDAQDGVKDARKALKLLNDGRFKK